MTDTFNTVEELYNLSELPINESNESKIRYLVSYNFYEWEQGGVYHNIDTVIYNIDVEKINRIVAKAILEFSQNFKDDLVMRDNFIQNCKNRFRYDGDLEEFY